MINDWKQAHTLNAACNPLNESVCDSKQIKIVCHCGVAWNWHDDWSPRKQSHTNFIGGNSKFGGRFGHAFHYEYSQDKILSFSKCKHLLMKIDYNYNCEDCLSWNLMNGKYSKIVTDENLGTTTKPC